MWSGCLNAIASWMESTHCTIAGVAENDKRLAGPNSLIFLRHQRQVSQAILAQLPAEAIHETVVPRPVGRDKRWPTC